MTSISKTEAALVRPFVAAHLEADNSLAGAELLLRPVPSIRLRFLNSLLPFLYKIYRTLGPIPGFPNNFSDFLASADRQMIIALGSWLS